MTVLVTMVVLVFAVTAKQALDRRHDAARNLALIDTYRELLIAKERIRVQQGAVSEALSDPDPADATMLAYITQVKAQATRSFDRSIEKMRNEAVGRAAFDLDGMIAKQRDYNAMFNLVWRDIHLPRTLRRPELAAAWPAQGAALVSTMEMSSTILSNQIQNADSVVGEMNRISGLAWALRDVAGMDRRHVSTTIDKGGVLPDADRLAFAEANGRIDAPWALLAYDMQLPDMPQALKTAHARAQEEYFGRLLARRNLVLEAMSRGESPHLTELQWWSISEKSLASLAAISSTALDLMHDHVAAQVSLAKRNLYVSMGSMLVILGFVLLASLLIALRVIRPLAVITQRIQTVAAGDLKGAIPFVSQNDEIGRLARALQLFRDNAVDKQRLETELLQNQIAKDAAEASNRARAQFFANMSHELRTPLNAIIGFSELMRQKLFGPLSERYEEYAGLINTSGQHLLALVSDILDISKMEAGKFVLDFQSVDLSKALDGSLRMVEKRARDNGITLTKDLPSELHLTADERAITQILLNILSNAVKFTTRGGRVHIVASAKDGQIKISVQDTGIGIPEDALSRLGRAFEQVSNDPALAREGSGLGLALVRALVELHGGTLRIESKVGVGTTVMVEIPQTQLQRAAAA